LCARSLGRCRALAVTRGRCNLPAGQHSGKSANGRLRPPKQRVTGQFHDAPDAGGRHRHSQAPRRGTRVAGRGVPRYSCGYKTRVFTGAICPVPHQTGTVVSKGAPTCQEPQPTSSPSSSSQVVALAFMLVMVNYANSHPQWGSRAPADTDSTHPLEGAIPGSAPDHPRGGGSWPASRHCCGRPHPGAGAGQRNPKGIAS
jgi:hypothetical protein